MIRTASRLGLLLLAALPLHAFAEKSVQEHGPLAADGTLDVSNVAGEVAITGWDRNEIEVTGEIGSSQHMDFDADGQHARVELRWDHHGHDDDGDEEEEADISIRVPKTARVRASTVSARITARDLVSELHLQSVSGDIETQVFSADVTLGTISGTIQVDGHGDRSDLRLSLVSGDAWVRGVSGYLRGRTVSGDLNIRAGKLGRTRIDTTSGDLNLHAALEKDARFEVDSTSGDVQLELCDKPEAEYDLSSFSGEIQAFDRHGEQRNEHGPTSDLRFKVGSGSALVRIDTLSGEIYLHDC
jgi:DUF4097 and DUF4098 domain-containing protein YvlB